MPGSPRDHDRPTAAPDRVATGRLGGLREELARLRLDGAIFLLGEYSEQWAYESLPAKDAAAVLAPGAEQVILFHVVGAGRCWIEVPGGPRLWADSGDVIVLPYNDPHCMGGTAEAPLVPIGELIAPPPWEAMPVVRHGEGGASTRVVCGYLTCDDVLFDPRMRVFPPVFVVSPDGPARAFVRASVDYALQQTAPVAVDRIEGPAEIPQLLLTEVIRLHLAGTDADHGWLRALRDPVLGPVLSVIHADPARKWDLITLARHSAVSVSLLDERFREALGVAPIRYLTRWRMHLATGLLRSTDLPVATIARRVGYESEEAFSRAFKRECGRSPSALRRNPSFHSS